MVKGQSSVEYLVTYGWMVVAVSAASIVFLPTTPDRGCSTEIETNFPEGVKIENIGVENNETLLVVLKNTASRSIDVNSVWMDGPRERLSVTEVQKLGPGEETTYRLGTVNQTENCNEFETEVSYEKGPLERQEKATSIRAGYKLVQSFLKPLKTKGDSAEYIKLQSTVRPANETICIGSKCPTEFGESKPAPEKYVNYSGDTMRGTLNTSEINADCYGVNCPDIETESPGFLNRNKTFMEGTLNVTQLKPRITTNRLIIQ